MILTPQNYFSIEANKEFMSVSQFKAFEQCQTSALAEVKGECERETTTALLVGQYIDAYFEGALDKFVAMHPEMFKRDGTLKADFLQADEIIKRVNRDRLWMEYATGQQQIIMTGEINGVAVKIMLDSLHPDKIVDRKIVKDFENIYVPEKGSVPWFEAWGYDTQGAVYQEIVRQNIGKRLPFYLTAATKEKTTDIDIVHCNQQMLDFALEHFAENIQLYDAIKKGIIEPERCEKCVFCKETKILTEPTESNDYYM